LNKETRVCFDCGGHGFPDKDCPTCGKKKTGTSFNLIQNPETKKNLLITSKLKRIPDQYVGVSWNKEFLMTTHAELISNQYFLYVIDQLEKIHTLFANGRIPTKSAIIIAPPKFGKITFAYSCMQYASLKGFTVAPLLDTQEVKRLCTLAADRPSVDKQMKELLGVTYDEYVSADVVFVTIIKTVYREEAYMVIEDLLDKRSRKGLPTFFVSRYSLETMSKRDWGRSFDVIKSSALDVNEVDNPLKYPVVIRFTDYREKMKGE